MKKPKDLRIVFFGTPDFAALQMAYLLQKEYNIVAAVTAPDKPAGRGKKLSFSAVKQKALDFGLMLLQPEKLKDQEFIQQLEQLQPDLFIVIAFRMLPPQVWQMPPMGTFNLHASLLPDYRGAAPINRAIMNGETVTGLTTFLINQDIDAGHILLQESMIIAEDETAGQLHDRMIEKGKILTEQTIIAIADGNIQAVAQTVKSNSLKNAPKIFRDVCRIDWTQSGRQVHNHIRGLSPYPAAFTQLENEKGDQMEMKITKGQFVKEDRSPDDISRLLTDNRTYLKVALADGFYHLLEVQVPGKKVMEVREFLAGRNFDGKWRFL